MNPPDKFIIRRTAGGAKSAHPSPKSPGPAMRTPTEMLTLQLLEWMTERPRRYAEAVATWQTTCPRLSVWEDACIDGLVDCDQTTRIVSVSAKGRALHRAGGATRGITGFRAGAVVALQAWSRRRMHGKPLRRVWPASRGVRSALFGRQGRSGPEGAGGTRLAPTSFSRRLNSGDSRMMVPAAARRRSTASAGRVNDVGCWFR